MLELYGAKGCPYTKELRESLLWDGKEFVEYDVEEDKAALKQLVVLTGGGTVPVLVEDGQVIQIGVSGRGCMVALPSAKEEKPLS
ncbi:NrdH-redoxin [Bacillaceae bacterium ZC4]|jgi:glutaredoxin 3|uniref:NrdH-redoxin n=2 Tax=Bacillaceae TaxID=186817 RepID=A0A164AC45_9BACI|nr:MULTISPECIES: Uxx-star family glutaredoxin-like (seleno)protein [Aeribacillus]AXI40431.1 NrdH-redoxin [Bacillaceae bacterium ZC4]REJ21850.1 MAG: NrdH-redoxin [Bacillaceae bacterium]KZM56021.1 NrdH-redoxin [Aeribacillus pallidus]KZN96699.1 NrdH-redoxin [Aeribacillus pallidus]MED0650794.1 Uxx-star family glutaredoxin-like (seleno)protein [Aeribacillus composti]